MKGRDKCLGRSKIHIIISNVLESRESRVLDISPRLPLLILVTSGCKMSEGAGPRGSRSTPMPYKSEAAGQKQVHAHKYATISALITRRTRFIR